MIGVGSGKGRLVYQRLESWVWYRKRLSGVPTALSRGFVQGKAVWCTNALNRGFGTGKGFLVYQPP